MPVFIKVTFSRVLKIFGVLIIFYCLNVSSAYAQKDFFAPSPQYNSHRVVGVAIAESFMGTAVTIGLNYLWYKKFPHSKFHYFNDNSEWLGMDKVGHATTAYNIASIQGNIMHWGGIKQSTSAAIGTLTALGFMTMIEIMDGHSSAWGFSKGDMLANLSGCLLYEGQQLLWGEQRVGLKFSYHRTLFPKYNPQELGATPRQQILKDYNGQTYWLSANIASFLPSNNNFPRWCNIAVGYGAEGMTGASYNPSEINGKEIPSFKRYRQFYLSADADLYRINNLSPFSETFLKLNRTLKMVAPTLEWNSVQQLNFHWLYY